MQKFIFLLLILACNGSIAANSIMQEAIDAFAQKNYKEAAQLFEKEILTSGGDAALYYNLGTSYLQTNNIAKARLNLERAALLNPNNKDISNNLSIVLDRVSTTVIPLEDFFLKRWYQGLISLLSPTIWAMLSLLSLVISCILIYLSWFGKSDSVNKPKAYIIATIALGLVSMVAGISRNQMLHHPQTAVVMTNSELKSSATQTSETLKRLSPGVKLKIRETIDDWLKVNTMDLEEGWIKTSDIEQI